MLKNLSQVLFWSVFFICSVFYFYLKQNGSSLIELLYSNGQIEFLNQICQVNQKQSLPYYIDQAQVILLGPLQVLIAGLLFLSLCLKYLTHSNPFRFGLAVFIYLVITKYDALFFPPYGESITGPFSDAIWLVHHNLDYLGLLKQDTFATLGPQIYPTSIYPLFLATLMTILPTAKVFLVVIHLIVFSMTASIVSVFRNILLKRTDKTVAICGAILLISLPLLQSMSELINMEIPCLFFAIFSVNAIICRKFAQASIFSVLSLLVKAPGSIFCALVFICAVLLFFIEPHAKDRWQRLFWGSGAVFLAILKGIIRSHIIGEQTINNTVGFLLGWPNLRHMTVLWIFISAFVLILLLTIWNNRRNFRALIEQWSKHFHVSVMLMAASMWFLLYLNFSVMGYRYEVLLAPFFIFTLFYVTTLLIKNSLVLRNLMIVAIAICFYCAYGLVYDRDVESSIYSYNRLERSLEYRNDLKLHMKFAKDIEQNYHTLTIGAPIISAQALAFSELGYVDKPLNVFLYGFTPTNGLKGFTGLKDIDILRTVWIGFFKSHIHTDIPYPIDPKDKILKEYFVGDKKAALFMGGLAVEKVRILIELSLSGVLDILQNEPKK